MSEKKKPPDVDEAVAMVSLALAFSFIATALEHAKPYFSVADNAHMETLLREILATARAHTNSRISDVKGFEETR